MKKSGREAIGMFMAFVCCGILMYAAEAAESDDELVLFNALSNLVQQVHSGVKVDHVDLQPVYRMAAHCTNATARVRLLHMFENQLFAINPEKMDFRAQASMIDNVWDLAKGVWGGPPGGTASEWWIVIVQALAWVRRQVERIESSEPEDRRTWPQKWGNVELPDNREHSEWLKVKKDVRMKYADFIKRLAQQSESDRYSEEFRAWCRGEIEKVIGRPLTDEDLIFKADVLKRREERKRCAHDEEVRRPHDGGDVLPHPFTFLGCTFGSAYDLSHLGGKYTREDEILHWLKNFRIDPYFGKVWMMVSLAPRSKMAYSASLNWSGQDTREELFALAKEIRADIERRHGITLGDFFFESGRHVCDEATWWKADGAMARSRSVFGPIRIELEATDNPRTGSPGRRLNLTVTDTATEALVEKERKENPMKYDREAERRRHERLMERARRKKREQKQNQDASSRGRQTTG